MIFSLIMIVLVGAVAYFHYVQGVFSAFLSAVFAAIAAVLAVGFYEQVLLSYAGGTRADYLAAGLIVIIFAASYTLLRLLFDGFVPGNIRVPVLLDKIGAGVFGVVAAVFATGTIAVAAQTLPLGPSIIDYSRLELRAVEKRVMMRRQMSGPLQSWELDDDTIGGQTQSMLLPVDEWLIDFVTFQSGTGALAGSQSFTDRHPDLLTQLFAQRLGTQPGVMRSAVNVGGGPEVEVSDAFLLTTFKQVEGESPEIRKADERDWANATIDGQPIVLRVKVSGNATGTEEQFVRFGTGSARLVVGEPGERQNIFPFGTLGSPDAPNVVARQKPTDYLLLPSNDGTPAVDLVFAVPQSAIVERSDDSGTSLRLAEGTFFEFKRYGAVDLSNLQITSYRSDSDLMLVRKPKLRQVLEAVQGGQSYEEAAQAAIGRR